MSDRPGLVPFSSAPIDVPPHAGTAGVVLESSHDPTPAVIGFDLDLTLVDTRQRIVDCFQSAMAELGHPVSVEDVVPLLGMPVPDKAALLAPELDGERILASYRRFYDDPSLPPCPPMPGARAALEAVVESGAQAVVVSAKLRRAVEQALDGAGLADLVRFVYGDVFAAAKSAPLLRHHSRWYVGDHPGDIAAAHGAQAVAVAVATGAHDPSALRAAGADVVLADLMDFPQWWASAHQR